MLLEELINKLVGLAKAERPDLVSALRETFDPQFGSFDERLVSQLEKMLLVFLPRFTEAEKIEAYNELADDYGLSRLDASDLDIDFWIHQSFIDPVLDTIVEKEQ